MLRCDNGTRSQVIDVNGWSFVKGNETYYGKYRPLLLRRGCQYFDSPADKTADILAALCMRLSTSIDRSTLGPESTDQEAPMWTLKANVTVFRHADRTPKVYLFVAKAFRCLILIILAKTEIQFSHRRAMDTTFCHSTQR
jgi:hypothetical protein